MFGMTRLTILGRSPLLKRTLSTTPAKPAGWHFIRTSMPQTLGDSYNNHADVRYMVNLIGLVLLGNATMWYHGSQDPRFYFGWERPDHLVPQNRWMKYMTEKMWCAKSGFGLAPIQSQGSVLFYGEKKGHPSWPRDMDTQKYGFKEAWRRDLFLLICDIETYEPAGCPTHPLPLGGCGLPVNADSALTKVLKFEGKPLMYCERCFTH